MQTAFYIFQIILGMTCAYMTINWFLAVLVVFVAFHKGTKSIITASKEINNIKTNAFILIILYTVFILLY